MALGCVVRHQRAFHHHPMIKAFTAAMGARVADCHGDLVECRLHLGPHPRNHLRETSTPLLSAQGSYPCFSYRQSDLARIKTIIVLIIITLGVNSTPCLISLRSPKASGSLCAPNVRSDAPALAWAAAARITTAGWSGPCRCGSPRLRG